jgi:hypothetical protein
MDHFGNKTTLQRVREELQSMSDYDLHQICIMYEDSGAKLGQYKLPNEVLYDSPKMQKLREIVPPLIEKGHHVLIFSQWTRTLDLLEELLGDLRIDFLRLDGSTPVRERQQLIDTYSTGSVPVFILSTKAGGLGINLTQADTVIMHDLDFNPENDRQVLFSTQTLSWSAVSLTLLFFATSHFLGRGSRSSHRTIETRDCIQNVCQEHCRRRHFYDGPKEDGAL